MNFLDWRNDRDFLQWRECKLHQYPTSIDQLIVSISDPLSLTAEEVRTLSARLDKAGMVIYQGPTPGAVEQEKLRVKRLGAQLGLKRLDANICADADAISTLQEGGKPGQADYIPYTNKPINWHTDGYYNDPDKQIYGMALHCIRPAADGGANALLDHEILYLLLRELNPEHIQALTAADAMTIPANASEEAVVRPAAVGPVFSNTPNGRLHMRYTHRTKSIQWAENAATEAAVAALRSLLETPSPYHFQAVLKPGMGLLCNNILHTRTGFEANSERLILRARYFDEPQPIALG